MAYNALIPVQVDALIAQGAGNLAVRLVASEGAGALPDFEAGAHVDLHLPNGLVRQYSIASAPAQKNYYTLCVRNEAANSRGGSRFIHEHLRVGMPLHISARRNLFKPQIGQPSLLIAGGIGITPLLSMAYAMEEARQPFELHYYVHKRAQAAFARKLHQGFEHGVVCLHVSEEGDSIRHALPPCLCSSNPEAQIYVCGPTGFMQHVRQAALAKGWGAEQVHQEAFGPSSDLSDDGRTTGAEANASFEVQLQSSKQVFTIAPHQSIAHVLLENGIDVPLSCEMGICGACLTPVLAGEPDHRDSVQSDADKAAPNAQMALCCSRSFSQRLVLAL